MGTGKTVRTVRTGKTGRSRSSSSIPPFNDLGGFTGLILPLNDLAGSNGLDGSAGFNELKEARRYPPDRMRVHLTDSAGLPRFRDRGDVLISLVALALALYNFAQVLSALSKSISRVGPNPDRIGAGNR